MKRKRIYKPGLYHVVFPTRFRIKFLISPVKERVAYYFKAIAAEKQYNFLEFAIRPEHVHLLIDIKPGQDLPDMMHMLKGRTSRRIFEEFVDLRQLTKYNHLWTSSYKAIPVPVEALIKVADYIKNQDVIHERRRGKPEAFF
jgi:putative transposase